MDLVGGWNSFWGTISGGGGIGTILATVGAVIIVVSIVGWLWKRRKGGGGGMSGFPWLACLFGAILAGPSVTIPAVLLVVQLLVGIVFQLIQWGAGVL